MKWGLTEEQIRARASGIGGSEARIVVHGTPEERYDLWQVRIGEKKPKKTLSDWAAALRHVTEGLQLDWYEHIHEGQQVIDRGASCVHPDYNWMRCTLDGRVMPAGVPINAKHVSRWTKEAREWAIEHYTCSTTHEATVLGASYGLLSLIHDEKEPEIIRIDVDPFYQADMVEREEAFWQCCVERVPPPDCAALDTPKVATEVKRLRTVDASAEIGSDTWKKLVAANNWLVPASDAARQFDETLAAFRANGAARNTFKEVVPADIGVITLSVKGGLFTGKQSAAGAWTLAVAKEEKDG